MHNIPQVVVTADGRLIEDSVDMLLYGLREGRKERRRGGDEMREEGEKEERMGGDHKR